MSLHDNLEFLQVASGRPDIPEHILVGLNPRFELRPYQERAFQNYLTYFSSSGIAQKPIHLLFHMATGSGKTLVMAGAILDLYTRGYRNFLFFVNSVNVLEKTRSNLMDRNSSKYLFAESIQINGEQVRVQEVDNFQLTDPDAINICFSTIQGLHTGLRIPRENSLTYDDLSDKPVVLISDEAHHLNALTGSLEPTQQEADDNLTWESTVTRLHASNEDNVLLEFTATVELSHPSIAAKYEDKIVFDYPLADFREDGYSKEIQLFQSDADPMDRALQALVLSQYRLKRFEDAGISAKPVVLLKSKTIGENRTFFDSFHQVLGRLDGERLVSSMPGDVEPFESAVTYFEDRGITWDSLALELREDFGRDRCKLLDSLSVKPADQLDLNSLEDADNPYRAIFVVNMLNEGWDVLNLFDIVRLYETRDARANRPGRTTIQEAQLIGRGARYFPFRLTAQHSAYERKFDEDLGNPLRICEELHFHSATNVRYIQELRTALRNAGAIPQTEVQIEYKLKESFRTTQHYSEGKLFLNSRSRLNFATLSEFPQEIRRFTFEYRNRSGLAHNTLAFAEDGVIEVVPEASRVRNDFLFKDIPLAVLRKALARNPRFAFSWITETFPQVVSTSQLLHDDKFLGGVKVSIIDVSRDVETDVLLLACEQALATIIAKLQSLGASYVGTKEFSAVPLKDVITDKTVLVTNPTGDGRGIAQSMVGPHLRVDLPMRAWFAYNDNYGTTEEKQFVRFFDGVVRDLESRHDTVYLLRNEGQAVIYAFEDGRAFQPDYILILGSEEANECEYYQVFVEPKGSHLWEKDAWKEAFLESIENEGAVVLNIAEDCNYTVWGLPFFASGDQTRSRKFQDAFDRLKG